MSIGINKHFIKQIRLVVIFFILVSGAFTYFFYTEAITNKKESIQEKSYLLSKTISHMAKLGSLLSKEKNFDFNSERATLSQIQATFKEESLSMEYLLARYKDDSIVFEAYSKLQPPNIKISQIHLAIPMRKALNNESGAVIDIDYNDNKVFAAYTKIEDTPWGLVIKQPYSEYVKPIIYKILVIIFLIVIFITMLLYFVKKNNQFQVHLTDLNKKANESLQLFSTNIIASNGDINGNITYASDALCKVTGYTRDELIGEPHSKLRHPETPSSLFKDMWETIQSKKIWEGEIKNLKKDGDFYWIRAVITPLFGENGAIVGYNSIRNDITAEKAKEQFMANMSHELRTPLNAIIGFAGILNNKSPDFDHRILTKQIKSSSNSLLKLINNILDLSKIQNSNFIIEASAFNAYDKIKEFTYQFNGLTTNKNLFFKINVSEELRAVFFGDWTRINQIILNLIANAVKFTPKDGEIIFDVNYIDKNFVMHISDNGIGIDKEALGRIFKPFEQEDCSTTRKYGGTGLGLSITYELIVLMNGTINVESEKGKGTVFTVKIPLEKTTKTIINTEEIEKVKNKDYTLEGHVLVVEDNKTNQILITMLLSDFGLTCDVANDGVEAVNLYDPEKHVLVLMDENMPNMNGLEAMNFLHEKYKDKCGPIIAVTANAMEGDKEKFISLGMDSYISKPIDGDELYKILKEFL